MFEALPVNTKGSLSKHLKTLASGSLPVSWLQYSFFFTFYAVLGFLLSFYPLPIFFTLHGSSKAPIIIPAAPVTSQAKGKGPKISAAPIEPVVPTSPTQAISQSMFQLPACFRARTPLAPLFAEGCPPPYIPRWKITTSTVVNTPEIVRDFMSHALPPSHRFMNFCRVVNAEQNLLEKEEKEKAWEEERAGWMVEMERLVGDVKHYKVVGSVSGMKRKETPHYNSKAKKKLAKLDEEFSGQTPALLFKLLDYPLMSLQ
ncbi:hypothetical protein Hanom_Chr04g00329341 [Helianthus anomalus]